jgi:hypothetical protein
MTAKRLKLSIISWVELFSSVMDIFPEELRLLAVGLVVNVLRFIEDCSRKLNMLSAGILN